MDDETNVIEFPQPEPAPVLPFDTVDEVEMALAWMQQLIADSRAVIAKAPHFGDPASLLETWIEVAQMTIDAARSQYDGDAALRGLNQIFIGARCWAGR